ncbi:hypothetical protein JXB12_13330 [candidate division KSB1 bacterium]|nr:hypothetical protein [candidate division KSB1 bacterium]
MVTSPAHVLMITNQDKDKYLDLLAYLEERGYEMIIENDWGASIERVQDQVFNVIVLDTSVKGIDIPQAIHIFRNFDPNVKIIVKTHNSTRQLESEIRKEKIYYYHIDSFDSNDLKLAIRSAIEQPSKYNEVPR